MSHNISAKNILYPFQILVKRF